MIGSITIDGNKSLMNVNVNGSAVYITYSGVVNMYDGINIINS